MKSIGMESQSLPTNLIKHIIKQMIESCNLIMTWNECINEADGYLISPIGMEKMAASCMLIEAIGEGVKKIDKIAPGFLAGKSPETPWKQIAGLRDHIAHGYFNLDADVIFDVVKGEIPLLKEQLSKIIEWE